MADDELQTLVKKRSILKGLLTRFKHFIDKLDQTNETSIKDLQLRLSKIDTSLDDFYYIQDQIELSDIPENALENDTERESFENNYFSIKSIALKILESKGDGLFDSQSVHSQSVGSSNNSINQNRTKLQHVKLPALSLPTFSGEFYEWLSFYDTFKSLIHDNEDLTNVQKYHYLKSSIKGDAALTIQSIQISAENYSVAWELLKENYENKPRIINNHIKALFDMEVISKESYALLQQLLNNTRKHLRALKMLQQPTEHWDTLIVYLVSTKLDHVTKREWEKLKSELNDLATVNDLTTFLTKKCQLLESLHTTNKRQVVSNRNEKSNVRSYVSVQNQTCKFCKENHPIHQCKSFLDLSVRDRINEISNRKLCKNCFRHNHQTRDCTSSQCRKCNLKHNTLLHLATETKNYVPDATPINNSNSTELNPDTNIPVGLNCSYSTQAQVLLPTALVYISGVKVNKLKCRILLDSASQCNFITKNLFEKLGCKGKRINMPVFGINNTQSPVLYETKIKIDSMYNSFNCTISCLVLPEITQHLPQSSLNISDINVPDNLQLADPNFNESREIQLLLGAEFFWKIICIGQIPLGKNLPVAQKTHFGWVISGSVLVPKSHEKYHNSTCYSCLLTTNTNDNLIIQQQLSLFWKLEEINAPTLLTREEIQCEEYFLKTTERNKNGQFIVRLPFKNNISDLGESYSIAKRRFFLLENRMELDIEMKETYVNFMQEYTNLGHMTRVNYTHTDLQNAYFLPHHAVFKSDSITSKLRVVFDGSCKTSSGVSLNDTLMVGPTIQPDLFSILMRFRLHEYAFTSDCEKMYRQVIVHENDRIKQNILWRCQKFDQLECYQLNTVTYGTASAPYLATRCLVQVAKNNEDSFPDAANIIKNDFYIDDLISGGNSIESSKILIEQINHLLKSSGFTLRKWASNCPDILNDLEYTTTIMHFNDENDTVKTLGLIWNSKLDTFQFPVNFYDHTRITKRTILSTISKIFDPLGLVGPIVITTKILLQRLWQLNLNWDESVPNDLYTSWIRFRNELNYLSEIVVPRHILCSQPKFIQLHAFSDASETSFGTCIYLRSTNSQGHHTVHLLCAKSRVAPLQSITLPKLELCAAHLLVKLVSQVRTQLHININEYYYWCDSTIVLAWLLKPPSQLKSFVANRIAEMINLTDPAQWHHVRTFDNPADVISRGTTPRKLAACSLWWHGPSWLTEDTCLWPISDINLHQINPPEIKNIKHSLVSTKNPNFMIDLIGKYSSLNKLQRVLAYCLRFIKNSSNSLESRTFGSITVHEIQIAMNHIIKSIQLLNFSEDISCLLNKQTLSRKSNLLSLNPFLDKNQILRVGGRLKNSELTYLQKFPCILPTKHDFTTLIIRDSHIKTFHAGPQVVLSNIRQNGFWIISGLTAVKRIIKNCVTCRRLNLTNYQPLMGDLPTSRITPSRPFSICGTDFAGPFTIKESKGRGRKTSKAYLCVFVCFATKAAHLEVVGDLTTVSFIACLRRFISRRGLCHTIHSDNGTNYVGANTELKAWYQLASTKEHNDEISKFLTTQSINWKFIPARSPHFGGLWESLVKSVKRHLFRIMRDQIFTFEEILTLFAQIEAILNSRPLIPLTSNPNDYDFLSPGHFLIGDSLLALPEPNILDIKLNRLSRFQLVQHCQQQFWKNWSSDYLNTLQSRVKWNHPAGRPIQQGTLVLLRERTPPLSWRMGRITEIHPGADGIIRVVTVQTSTGCVKRAVTQICELLNESCSDSSLEN